MTRYFFDLQDGAHEPDDTGVELAGDAEARQEAIRFLGEILKLEPDRLVEGTLRVLVSDADRTRLFTISAAIDDA